MTKASLALLCLMVGVISAAEIDFKHNRKSNFSFFLSDGTVHNLVFQ
jgi:hypothetical protein